MKLSIYPVPTSGHSGFDRLLTGQNNQCTRTRYGTPLKQRRKAFFETKRFLLRIEKDIQTREKPSHPGNVVASNLQVWKLPVEYGLPRVLQGSIFHFRLLFSQETLPDRKGVLTLGKVWQNKIRTSKTAQKTEKTCII